MTIGDRIKNLRITLGLTQDDLAASANTTKQTIHKYEIGKIKNIPASKIQLLADRLNTTPSYLMGWVDRPMEVSDISLEQHPATSVKDDTTFDMFKQLDDDDKAEIRGEIKQMLKADKYKSNNNSISSDIIDELKKAQS